MLLIMITIAAGVSFYVYSTKLLGNFEGANAPVTMDNLRIEAYNWNTASLLTLNVSIRNVGTNILTISTAHWFVGGIMQTAQGCSTTLSPGVGCTAKITISQLTPASGIVYVVKVVLSDGAIFSASAIAGQVTGQTGVP
jgi:hypothetical protein